VFNCPSTEAKRAYAGGGSNQSIQDYSNWPWPLQEYCTYSYSTPYGNLAAQNGGWKFDVTSGSDFPFASDVHPGQGGVAANAAAAGTLDPREVAYTSPKREMMRGLPNNHRNEGMNVSYTDGHVEWQTTPFCGPLRPSQPFRDNIFTSHVPSTGAAPVDPVTGKGGDFGQPKNRGDAVMGPRGSPAKM
jgi:prepilin-type processing-associated H-X9-DG protein